MSAQPLTVTIVTSLTLFGRGSERYYFNGELAFNGNKGDMSKGVTTTLHQLMSLGFDVTVERVLVELPYDFENPIRYSRWIQQTSGAQDFTSLNDLLAAAKKDPNLSIL